MYFERMGSSFLGIGLPKDLFRVCSICFRALKTSWGSCGLGIVFSLGRPCRCIARSVAVVVWSEAGGGTFWIAGSFRKGGWRSLVTWCVSTAGTGAFPFELALDNAAFRYSERCAVLFSGGFRTIDFRLFRSWAVSKASMCCFTSEEYCNLEGASSSISSSALMMLAGIGVNVFAFDSFKIFLNREQTPLASKRWRGSSRNISASTRSKTFLVISSPSRSEPRRTLCQPATSSRTFVPLWKRSVDLRAERSFDPCLTFSMAFWRTLVKSRTAE